MSPWIPALLTLAGLAVLLAGHLLVIGRMTGTFATTLQGHGDRLDKIDGSLVKVGERIESVEDEVADETSRRSGLEQRLDQVEQAAKVMWDVRDKLTAMNAANEVHEQYRREKWDRLERQVDGMARQLGTIASKGLEYRPGESTT